jgi:hypothetical protein
LRDSFSKISSSSSIAAHRGGGKGVGGYETAHPQANFQKTCFFKYFLVCPIWLPLFFFFSMDM